MEFKRFGLFLSGFICAVLVFFVASFNYGFLLTGYSILGDLNYSDRILSKDIVVFDDYLLIKISNVTISSYSSTNSMGEFFSSNANGIRIVPKSEGDIFVGDIVSFRMGKELIVHRVVEIGRDEGGVYFITRGDNNNFSDGKIRFSEIEYVTVGVLW